MLKCCPGVGFQPGMSNVAAVGGYCISTHTLSVMYVVSTVHLYLRICDHQRCIRHFVLDKCSYCRIQCDIDFKNTTDIVTLSLACFHDHDVTITHQNYNLTRSLP